MNNISFGQYYPAESVIHRLDPRAKVIMSVLYIVCTFLCKNLSGFVALVLSSLFLIFLSKIPARLILRSMRPLILIIAFTSLINIFLTQGENLLTPPDWWIKIYAEGIWNLR